MEKMSCNRRQVLGNEIQKKLILQKKVLSSRSSENVKVRRVYLRLQQFEVLSR